MTVTAAKSFHEECLEEHNVVRSEHDCPALVHSADLADEAHAWAEKIAAKNFLSYAENPGIGENITFFPTSLSGREVVRYWAKEREQYNYDKPGWQNGTNYFTQVVWRNTVEMGVGRATTEDKSQTVVVAFYKPAGNSNRAGEFAANVPRRVR